MDKASLDLVIRAVRGTLDKVGASGKRIVVGLSGGVDSVVLLHALTRVAPALGCEVSALHVHHGLSRNADAWSRFCEHLCTELCVQCSLIRVQVERGHALGLEAAAREARYRVYCAQQADLVMLAHHLDDQAETVLLQLLRGAGVRGLSAMPPVRSLDHAGRLHLVRPLLDLTRAQLVAYARSEKLTWVEDESNADPAMDRNFLRAHIMPAIAQRFPAASKTLQRSAENAADAARLLDELARLDAHGAVDEASIDVSVLAALSRDRARNLMRWFIEQQGLGLPSRDRLEEALRQALDARRDARVEVALGAALLRRHRGRVYLEAAGSEVAADWNCAWRGEACVELPGALGTVQFEPAVGAGLSLQRLREPTVIRARNGGERMRLGPAARQRTLKNLLQEAGVPHWRRERLPLLFCANDLVWVPEIGVDCRYAAQSGEAGVQPQWIESKDRLSGGSDY